MSFGGNILVKNISFIFGQNFIRLVAGLLVGVWMARFLGVESYGLFNYVISFLFLFQPLVNIGLDEAIVKELKGDSEKHNVILGTAATIRIASTLFSWILMALTIYKLNLPNQLVWLTALYCSSTLFSPLNGIESYYYSDLQIGRLVKWRTYFFLFLSLLKILFIIAKLSLFWFVLVSTIEMISMGLISLLLYHLQGRSILSWVYSAPMARILLKQGLPIFFNNMVIRSLGKIDQMFIAKMSTFTQLGLYGAAVKLVDVWQFIPFVVSNVFYTRIVEAKSEEESTKRIMQFFFFLFWTSSLLCLGCFVLGRIIISLAYGKEFLEAIPYLKWYSVQFFFSFYAAGRAKYFASIDKSTINFSCSLSILLINCVLNYYLILRMGAIGVIYASIIANLSTALFFSLISKEFRKINILYFKSIFYPIAHR